jgi:uncharacterized Tic20 family protein
MNPEPLPPVSSSSLSPDQEKLWGMLAHLLSFAAAYVAMGFLAPLAIMIMFGERSSAVRAHAVESLNFQLTTLIWVAVGITLSVMTFGFGLVLVLPIAGAYALFYLVVVIIAGLRANHGETYRYPLTIRFVK